MIAGQRPSIIDNIFINIFEKSFNSGSLTDKTDHLPNFLFIVDFIDQQKNQKIRIRNIKAFNGETYFKDPDSLKSLNYINFANANEIYNEFHNKLIAVIDKNAPYKTLSKQVSKTKQKPWITKSIIKSIKTKNIYYKKFLKTKSKFWYDRYKYYRNTINKLINKSKNNHLRNYFQENY